MMKEASKDIPKRGIFHDRVEVKLQNLTKEFVDKKGKVTVAVNDFSVTIPAGKLIGLLGPSGCGKSTTLYLISGLHKPNSGTIFFGDDDVTNTPPEKRGIGLVFQNYALYPHMTVKQNILFPLENMRVPKAEAQVRAKKMAELVHIGDLMDRKPNQLSGGQQQRVAIARALVKEPRVLLLDEPLSNLDARLRLQTREEIRRIQKETGVTTIFVTHDQEEAMSISDEIIVMNDGLKQQIGHPQDVYEEPINQFVAKFLGNPPINIVPGKLKGEKVVLENGVVIDSGVKQPNQDINIGLRPEYLKLSDKGKIEATVDLVEHIGRDTMLICYINEIGLKIRAIISSERRLTPGEQVKFECSKLFVFNKTTGERYK
ncbi:MAG: ABC transporter ATP-binding protein [Bacilli bacterium]|nr:ABC transporter ATP-binding protein [Bacilli bacterium]MDD4076940.1 ABC transporter ATP-binding protein [Bacilli bacterium]MDD4387650.1 ABC transporter ATP-binding protein [Bacilli bacterium]